MKLESLLAVALCAVQIAALAAGNVVTTTLDDASTLEDDVSLRAAGDGAVTVVIDNVVPGLWYGIGRAESPAGPYVVDEWIRAKSTSRWC